MAQIICKRHIIFCLEAFSSSWLFDMQKRRIAYILLFQGRTKRVASGLPTGGENGRFTREKQTLHVGKANATCCVCPRNTLRGTIRHVVSVEKTCPKTPFIVPKANFFRLSPNFSKNSSFCINVLRNEAFLEAGRTPLRPGTHRAAERKFAK